LGVSPGEWWIRGRAALVGWVVGGSGCCQRRGSAVVSYRSGIADRLSLRFGFSFLVCGGSAGCLRLYVANKRACATFWGVVSRQRAIELVQVVAGLPMVWYELSKLYAQSGSPRPGGMSM